MGPCCPARPNGPVGPVGPGSPTGPKGPAGPVTPVGPGAPVGPVGPVGPSGPVGPVGPTSASPLGPVGPVGPASPAGPVGPSGPIGPPGGSGVSRLPARQLPSAFDPVAMPSENWLALLLVAPLNEGVAVKLPSDAVFTVTLRVAALPPGGIGRTVEDRGDGDGDRGAAGEVGGAVHGDDAADEVERGGEAARHRRARRGGTGDGGGHVERRAAHGARHHEQGPAAGEAAEDLPAADLPRPAGGRRGLLVDVVAHVLPLRPTLAAPLRAPGSTHRTAATDRSPGRHPSLSACLQCFEQRFRVRYRSPGTMCRHSVAGTTRTVTS